MRDYGAANAVREAAARVGEPSVLAACVRLAMRPVPLALDATLLPKRFALA